MCGPWRPGAAQSNRGGKTVKVHIRNLRPEEVAEVQELLAISFVGLQEHYAEALSEYAEEPWYGPENVLVAEAEGRLVGHVGIKETSVWIAGQRFRTAKIGSVCTHPDFRRQGVAARLMQAARKRARGCELSSLDPAGEEWIVRFYERCGYVQAVRSQPIYRVDVEALGEMPPRVLVRPARLSEAQGLNRIYNDYYRTVNGTLGRTTRFWERRLCRRPKLWLKGRPDFLVLEGRIGPVGYLAVLPEGEAWRVLEWATLPEGDEQALALLADVAMPARLHKVSFLDVNISPAERLFNRLATLNPTNVSPPAKWVMLQVTNPSLFRPKFVAALADRLPPGSQIEEQEGQVELTCPTTPRLTLRASWSHLLSLLYDGRILSQFRERREITVRPDEEVAWQAVREIFPPTISHRREMDGY